MQNTRRRFLLGTLSVGALAVGLGCNRGAGGPPPSVGPSHRTGKKLGVALLGLGKYSSEQLAPALQQTQHCELRGIVTGTPSKISTWQERHGVHERHVYDYDGFKRIADDDAIDVVYVVVPTGLHAKYAVMAANAGKHVWCEKPMAMNVEECQQIIDACRANRVSLSIGYRMQHEPNTQAIRRLTTSKHHGAVTSVRALAGYDRGSNAGAGWRRERSLGGGALYDMGVYSINGIRYATAEEPVRVLRAKQWTEHPEVFTEVDETSEFELLLPSGVVAYGRTSVGEAINQLRVEAERGWYELSPMQRYTGVEGKTSDGTLLNEPIANQQARQMDNDALAIVEGRPVMVPGEEGLRDIRLVQAIMEAAEQGAPVDV